MEKDMAVAILGPEEGASEGDGFDAVCAELMAAIEAKDPQMLKSALGAYFDMKEALPHEEAEEVE